MCCFTYHYATPPLSMCKQFAPEWIGALYLRNLVLLWMFAGGWHLLLYVKQNQPADADGRLGMEKKYDKKWPGEHKKFLFGHQTYENVFMSCT